MDKVTGVHSTLFMTVLIITVSLAKPMQAFIIRKPYQSVTEMNTDYLALSWGDIWNRLSRKKVPGGKRGGNTCAIAPQKLVNSELVNSDLPNSGTQEVWSDRPLFLWYIRGGTVEKIELFQNESKQAFWSRKVTPEETKLIYDGKPLQPGRSYKWVVSANVPFPTTITGGPFQIMEAQKRDRITNELMKLEDQLKKQKASAEKIALEKANYFAQQELWSDALREIYSVPNPSPELTKIIQQIPSSNYCNPAAANAALLP